MSDCTTFFPHECLCGAWPADHIVIGDLFGDGFRVEEIISAGDPPPFAVGDTIPTPSGAYNGIHLVFGDAWVLWGAVETLTQLPHDEPIAECVTPIDAMAVARLQLLPHRDCIAAVDDMRLPGERPCDGGFFCGGADGSVLVGLVSVVLLAARQRKNFKKRR